MFQCGTIQDAQSKLSLSPQFVSVLQIDVEGFEKQLLNGYVDGTDASTPPPMIHFESKILRNRKVKNMTNSTTITDAGDGATEGTQTTKT